VQTTGPKAAVATLKIRPADFGGGDRNHIIMVQDPDRRTWLFWLRPSPLTQAAGRALRLLNAKPAMPTASKAKEEGSGTDV
jgi:hypothetical protein